MFSVLKGTTQWHEVHSNEQAPVIAAIFIPPTLTALGKGPQSTPVQVFMLLQVRMLQTVHASISFWCSTAGAVHLVFIDNFSLGLPVISPQPWYFTEAFLCIFFWAAFHSCSGHSCTFFEKYPFKPMSIPHPGLFLVLSFSSSLNTSVSWVLKSSLPRCLASIFSLQDTLSLSW